VAEGLQDVAARARAGAAPSPGGTAPGSAVELLLAVTGPQLSAAEAAKLLTAAAGDVNAAVNLFLDGRHNAAGSRLRQQQQQQAAGHKRGASHCSSSGGKTKKKLSRAAAGSQVITSFFSHKHKQQQQQQQQQQHPQGNIAASADLLLASDTGPLDFLSSHDKDLLDSREQPRPLLVAQPAEEAPGTPGAHKLGNALHEAPEMHQGQVWESTTCRSTAAEAAEKEVKAAVDDVGNTAAASEAPLNDSSGGPQQQQQQQQQQEQQQQQQQEQLAINQQQQQPADRQHVDEAGAPLPPVRTSKGKRSWQELFPGSIRPGGAGGRPAAAKRPKLGSAAPSDGSKPFPGAASPFPDQATASAAVVKDTAAASTALGTAGTAGAVMIGSSSASSSSSAAAAVPKELRDAPLLPLARYNPLRHACWTAGAPAPYLALALTLAAGGQVAGLEGQPACQ
jgi:hypothetical protein